MQNPFSSGGRVWHLLQFITYNEVNKGQKVNFESKTDHLVENCPPVLGRAVDGGRVEALSSLPTEIKVWSRLVC